MLWLAAVCWNAGARPQGVGGAGADTTKKQKERNKKRGRRRIKSPAVGGHWKFGPLLTCLNRGGVELQFPNRSFPSAPWASILRVKGVGGAFPHQPGGSYGAHGFGLPCSVFRFYLFSFLQRFPFFFWQLFSTKYGPYISFVGWAKSDLRFCLLALVCRLRLPAPHLRQGLEGSESGAFIPPMIRLRCR